MKRPITPHKGGRTVRVNARITPAAAEKLAELGISLGDLIEWAIQEKSKEPPS
jgi:predicted HicB family RNase H-like nuclease